MAQEDEREQTFRLTLGRGGIQFRLINKKKYWAARDNAETPPDPNKDGLMPVDTPPDEMAYIPQKNDILLNFWDMGQTKQLDGTYADTPYVQSPALTLPPHTAGSVVAADWAAIRDYFLGIDIATWQTRFRKIDYDNGHKYGLDIESGTNHYSVAKVGTRPKIITNFGSPGPDANGNITTTTWTAQGLKIKAGGNLRIINTTAFNTLDTADTARIKATYTPDFNATAVPVTLTKDANIFLMPKIYFTVGEDFNYGGEDPNILSFLGIFYMQFPRIYFLDNTFTYGNLGMQYPPYYQPLFSAQLSATDMTSVINYTRGLFGARRIGQVLGDTKPLSGFPATSYYAQDFDAFNGEGPGGINNDANVKRGAFLGLIDMGTHLYYLWATDGILQRQRIFIGHNQA